jgi:hypothetical protein
MCCKERNNCFLTVSSDSGSLVLGERSCLAKIDNQPHVILVI